MEAAAAADDDDEEEEEEEEEESIRSVAASHEGCGRHSREPFCLQSAVYT